MKYGWAILAGLMLAPCAARAQPTAESVVMVLGEATVSKPADYVTISGQVHGEGRNQQAALKALSYKRDEIEDTLSRLAGAKAVKFETSEIRFAIVRPAACRDDNGYRSR